MQILAIDPGITTGLATYIDGKYATCIIPKAFEAVYGFIMQAEYTWDQVILEGFATPGLIASYGIDTVELIGAIKALCYWRSIPLKVQYPIERRGSLQDAKTLLACLGRVRYPDHELDALAHLLMFQRKNPHMI